MKEYEKQCQKQQSELEELATAEARDKIEKFIGVSCTTSDAVKQDKPKLPSFWIPSLTPTHSSNTIKKPTNKTLCPMSGKPLRVKDLIDVKFTPLDSRGVVSKTSRSRYMCPVTHDTLNNSTPCAVLKPSGHVVTMKCVKDIIKPSMVCPLTGGKLNESDIIPIIRGGTGYSGIGVSLEANKQGAALMA
jgi:nitric oxide synthase-interacting protein